MRALPWVLAAVLLAVLFVRSSDPADDALRAQADSLRAVVVAAELRADSADARRRELQAEVDASAAAADSARRDAARADRAARRSIADADARLRATLDSVGRSAADVDSLNAGWRVQVEVRDVRISTLERQVGVLTVTLAAADSATEAQRRRADAIAAERDLLATRLGIAERRIRKAEARADFVVASGIVAAGAAAFDQPAVAAVSAGIGIVVGLRGR